MNPTDTYQHSTSPFRSTFVAEFFWGHSPKKNPRCIICPLKSMVHRQMVRREIGIRSIRERFARRRRRVEIRHNYMRQGAVQQVKAWDNYTKKPHRYIQKAPLETVSLHMLLQEIEESQFIDMQDLAAAEQKAVLRFSHFGF